MPSIDSESAEDARRVAEAQADAEQAEREAQVMYGHPVPAGPDAEREARRTIYWDRERRRAVAALDRYLETVYGPGVADFSRVTAAAGDRFIQAVIDVVLAMVSPFSDRYGAPCATCGSMTDDHDAMAHDALSERMARSEAVCRTCGYAPLEEAGSCPDCAAAHRERAPKPLGEMVTYGDQSNALGEPVGEHHCPDGYRGERCPGERCFQCGQASPTVLAGLHQKAHYGVHICTNCGSDRWVGARYNGPDSPRFAQCVPCGARGDRIGDDESRHGAHHPQDASA